MLLSRPSVTGIRPRAVSRNPAGVTPLAIFGRKAVVVEEEPPKSKGKSKEKAAPAPEK